MRSPIYRLGLSFFFAPSFSLIPLLFARLACGSPSRILGVVQGRRERESPAISPRTPHLYPSFDLSPVLVVAPSGPFRISQATCVQHETNRANIYIYIYIYRNRFSQLYFAYAHLENYSKAFRSYDKKSLFVCPFLGIASGGGGPMLVPPVVQGGTSGRQVGDTGGLRGQQSSVPGGPATLWPLAPTQHNQQSHGTPPLAATPAPAHNQGQI